MQWYGFNLMLYCLHLSRIVRTIFTKNGRLPLKNQILNFKKTEIKKPSDKLKNLLFYCFHSKFKILIKNRSKPINKLEKLLDF
jgi:hypothetical protein